MTTLTPNLVLLRHGQSYTNSGRHIDHEDQNILTEKGILDTIEKAKEFRAVHPDLHFDHTFCSPLHRAMQTGLNFLSIVDNKAVDFEIVKNLKERVFGFDGFLKIKDLLRIYGKSFDDWETDIDARPGDERGETLREVYTRAVDAYNSKVLPRLKQGDKVLIVSHYYTIKCLNSYLNYGDPHHTIEYNPQNSTPICFDIEV